MRRLFFIGVLIIICIIFLLLVLHGFKLGPIKVLSYSEIESLNINKKVLLSELNNKGVINYGNKEKELNEKVETFKKTKTEYEELVNNGTIKEDQLENYIRIYDFNVIWDTIQKNAKEKSVLMDMVIIENNEMVSISPKYKVYNLKFSIVGDYIGLTDFIYSLEDDDNLNFEIRNFEIENGTNGIVANFVVDNIPIAVDTIN